MLREVPAAYYPGSQDYAFLSSGDHVARHASSLDVSHSDYSHQRVPPALIQQHSAHYNSDYSLRPACSRTGDTPSSRQRFHPYERQSKSTTASDQQNLSLNQSSRNPSTNYSLAIPSTVTYTGHQHVPSRNEYHLIPSSTSVQHSLSYHAIPNAYTNELASTLIPNTPSTNQDDSSDLIEVHSPIVDPALPYPSSDDALALSSDCWDSISSHVCANQSSTTTPDGCTGPSSSYPSRSTAILSSLSAINTLYSSLEAPTMSQSNDASHSQVHTTINGGQGNTIFGDQENNVYYQTDDPLTDFQAINNLWSEIADIGAGYDSGVRSPPPRCHEGTRTKIQESILDWVQSGDPNNEPLCWLSGPAGVGKSAIAQTIAEKTSEGNLIASFFFWRGDSQRNNPSKLFLVIAYGLALKYPELRCFIGQVIKETPSVLKASIDIKLQKLIIEPLLQLTTNDLDGLIIIDALDECSGEKEQHHVLHLIESIFSKIQGRLPRILICSRPEPAIQETLGTLDKDLHVRRLTLDDNSESRRDIEKYLNTEFTRIRNCDRCRNLDFPDPWPSPSQIDVITWNASGQFIYATTIIKFIENEFEAPCKQLEKVLGQWKNKGGSSPFAPLDLLYYQILSSYPQVKQKQLRDTLGFVMYGARGRGANNPLTMELLYDLSAGEAQLLLRRARSVITEADNGWLQIIHKSFRDYLEDESRSHEFFIDKEVYSKTFFSRLMLEAVIREVKSGLTCISSDQRYCNCMIAITQGAFEYIWSADSTHEAFDTAEVYDFVIKISLFCRCPLPQMMPPCTHNLPDSDYEPDKFTNSVLSMHLGTTKNALPIFARLRLRIRREGMSHKDVGKLIDILQTLWMTEREAKEALQSSDLHEFLDTHKAIIISNLRAFDPESENYCKCSTFYWNSPVHLCGNHYIISLMPVLFMSTYAAIEDSSKMLELIGTLTCWEYGLRHLLDDGEYHLKKFEIIEKVLPTMEWQKLYVLFDWLVLSPIRLPAMGNAYHTRVLKVHTFLLDSLAFNDGSRECLPSHFQIVTRICGAEPELLDACTRWFEQFDFYDLHDCTDWCLEWLEQSFPAIHAKKSGVAIAKFNTLQQRWKDLKGAEEDFLGKRKSTEEVSELLFGELAPQDLDANDIHIMKEIVRGSKVSTKPRCRKTYYAWSWGWTLRLLRPRTGTFSCPDRYIEWIKPVDWPYAVEANPTAGCF
ncbi:hypothetical protein VNI00_015018 [Paramarasmius palmivorus]|uniref:Nephrocystin 3-like N-terminal domain-containing protein n=1 Tax=Paramarasmius palmivorus TaxID=297713 RepID=A0AAW0BNE2_9AGAR